MIVIDNKRLILRTLFATELVLFIWVYFSGTHGFRCLIDIRDDCNRLKNKISCKRQEVNTLKQQILSWNAHSFYKEKMAREQLQMARKDELIYYLS